MDDLWGANSYARRRSRVNRRALRDKLRFDYDLAAMRDLLVLFIHLVVTTVRLVRPAGARAIVAESLLLKQQLPVVTRPAPRTGFASTGPIRRGSMCRLDAADAPALLRNRSQARHDTAVSAVAGQPQVRGIVLTQTVRTTRAKGPFRRVDYRWKSSCRGLFQLPMAA